MLTYQYWSYEDSGEVIAVELIDGVPVNCTELLPQTDYEVLPPDAYEYEDIAGGLVGTTVAEWAEQFDLYE